MNLNSTPWNGPDIFVPPLFTKGDNVVCLGSNTYSGTVLSIGRRSPNWKIYVYQVKIDFDGSIGQFFENELEHD